MANGMNISFTISAVDDFSRTMSSLQKQTQQAFDAVGTVGKVMTGAGIAIAGGLGYAVKTASDFEAQISRVGAIAGATGTDLDALRKSAMELGASSSKSATEIAQGQESLAAMGFTTKEILGAMPGVIAAAEASGSDMAQTADVMASTLRIFNMEASKSNYVADVLAKTANISAASLTDMQYALKYAGPPAASLGVSLEDLSASIGIMTNAGMKGEQAGTTLRSALLSLLNPSEENSKLMGKLGIEVTDASGNFVGLSKLVGNLSDSMSGLTDTQKAANLAAMVGTESVSGMLTLMKAGPAEIDKMAQSLRNSGGASAEAAAKMKDNLKGALNELSGSFETLLITVGTALTPAIQALAGAVQWLLDKFNSMPKYMQTTLVVITALTAAFMLIAGPILILVAMLPAITAGFTAIAGAMGVTAGALAGIIGVIALVVAAVVAIGIALVVAYNKVGWFRDMVNAAWAQIVEYWNIALNFIKGIVTSVMDAVSSFISGKLADIKAFWDENGAAIMQVVQFYFTAIQTYIAVVLGVIKTVFQTVWPIISGIVKIAWALIQSIIGTAINIVLGVISVAMKLLQGDWSGAWNTIKKYAQDIWNDIQGYFENIDLYQIGKDIINGLINGISSMAGSISKKVSELASLIPKGLRDFLGIHSPSRVTMEIGEFTGEGLAIGLNDQLAQIKTASNDIATAAVPNVQSRPVDYGVQKQATQSTDSATRKYSLEIPVVISGREIARSTVDDLDALFAEKNRMDYRIQGGKR